MRKSDSARYAQSEAEGFDSFNRFTQCVIVWGCDDVLRQFSKWKLSMYAVVFEMEKLFFAIRKDMGHKNAGLRRGDILRIFTPDIEKHL